MTRALLLVTSGPASDAQAEAYHAWYTDVHLPQVLERVPGMVAAHRYVVDDASPAQPEHRYLATYEIEAEDPAGVLAALNEAMASGVLDGTDAIRTDLVALYREL